MSDLPQLICKDQAPILEFFGQTDQQSENDGQTKEQGVEQCHIENKLTNNELPFLGNDEKLYNQFKQFENLFKMQDEIDKFVIQSDIEKQLKFQNESSELTIIENEGQQ